MSNIPAYPLGNFQEQQKLQRRLLGWLPWKQTVLETGPFPLNEKLLHWKPPFLSASCQQLFCRRCPLEAEAAQWAELPAGAAAALAPRGHRAVVPWPRDSSPWTSPCHPRAAVNRAQNPITHRWWTLAVTRAAALSWNCGPASQGSSYSPAEPEHGVSAPCASCIVTPHPKPHLLTPKNLYLPNTVTLC